MLIFNLSCAVYVDIDRGSFTISSIDISLNGGTKASLVLASRHTGGLNMVQVVRVRREPFRNNGWHNISVDLASASEITEVSLFPGFVRNLGNPGTQSRGLIDDFQCGDDAGKTGDNENEGQEEIKTVVHWT